MRTYFFCIRPSADGGSIGDRKGFSYFGSCILWSVISLPDLN